MTVAGAHCKVQGKWEYQYYITFQSNSNCPLWNTQVGFQHVFDYEMYEWAVGDGDEYGENGCAVLFDCLPEEAGHYVMCYYSYKLDCIISVSDPFEVSIVC